MTEKDFSGGKTFGLRRHDVLLAPHLGNCALHQHEITGSPVKNHDNQRQEHMLEDALHPRHSFDARGDHSVDGKKLHPVGKKDQQDQTETV